MRLPVSLLSGLLLALVAGCGAGHDAAAKELAELRAEVTRLRAAQAALTERVDGIEIDRGSFAKGAATTPPGATPGAPSAAAGGAGGGDRPELSVVRLSPSEGDGDADNDAPRPLVRAVGSDGSVRKTRDAHPIKKGAAGAAPRKDAGPTVKP